MRVEIEDDLDLDRIAASGQCFRWRRLADSSWLIPAFGTFVIVRQVSDSGRQEKKKQNNISLHGGSVTLDLSCSPEEYEKIWAPYFDLNTSYRAIRKMVDPADAFLNAAAEAGRGIRILRQDPFETLISFLISQRKSIPAIQTAIERLCSVYGDPIGEAEGKKIFSFPSAERLAAMECEKYGYGNVTGTCPYREKGIRSCGLGYRLSYIKRTAEFAASNPAAMSDFSALSDDGLKEALLSFYGVGIKVCSCTMLFGFHRLDAFPVDVWMKRALAEHYPAGFDGERYRPYNGVMQQYMFAYYRSRN